MENAQRNALGTLEGCKREVIESVIYLDRLDDQDEARLDSVPDSVGLYLMIQPIGLVYERNGKFVAEATDRSGTLMRLLDSFGSWDRKVERYDGTIHFMATRTHTLSAESLRVLNFYLLFSNDSHRGASGLRCFRRVLGEGVLWRTKYGWRELNKLLNLRWEPLPVQPGASSDDQDREGGGFPRIGPAERGPWQQDREAVRGSSGDSPELVLSALPSPVTAPETDDCAVI